MSNPDEKLSPAEYLKESTPDGQVRVRHTHSEESAVAIEEDSADWFAKCQALRARVEPLELAYGKCRDAYAGGMARCAELEGALRTVLASAVPHPKEHPAMTSAWAVGRAALAPAAPEAVKPTVSPLRDCICFRAPEVRGDALCPVHEAVKPEPSRTSDGHFWSCHVNACPGMNGCTRPPGYCDSDCLAKHAEPAQCTCPIVAHSQYRDAGCPVHGAKPATPCLHDGTGWSAGPCSACGAKPASSLEAVPERVCVHNFKLPDEQLGCQACETADLRAQLATAQAEHERDVDQLHEQVQRIGLACNAAQDRVKELERLVHEAETDAWPAGTRQELIQLRDEKAASAQAVFAADKRAEEAERELEHARQYSTTDAVIHEADKRRTAEAERDAAVKAWEDEKVRKASHCDAMEQERDAAVALLREWRKWYRVRPVAGERHPRIGMDSETDAFLAPLDGEQP